MPSYSCLSSPTTLATDVMKKKLLNGLALIALPLVSTDQHPVCSHKKRSSACNYLRQLDVTPRVNCCWQYRAREGQRENNTAHLPSTPRLYLLRSTFSNYWLRIRLHPQNPAADASLAATINHSLLNEMSIKAAGELQAGH